MELSFGRRPDGKSYVRVKGKAHTDFTGQVRIETPYSNMTVTDTFDAISRYQTKDDEEGNTYDWYLIENHYRTQERFTPTCQKEMDSALVKQRGDIDYMAMMLDVDLETEEGDE